MGLGPIIPNVETMTPIHAVRAGAMKPRGGKTHFHALHWLTPGLLLTFFLSIYLLSGSSDLKHNGDTDLRYQTTQALVDNHRLWLDHPMWVDSRISTGRGGHEYVFYAPGQILSMVPLYVAGKVLAHHLSLPYDVSTLYASRSLDLFLGALLALVFFFMAESIGYTRKVSIVTTLVFGLATATWPDAQSALEQTQVDLFLLLAVYCVWRYVHDVCHRRLWMAAAGCSIGVAVFTRYDAVLYYPVLALYPLVMAVRTRQRRRVALDLAFFAMATVPWIAGIGVWNYMRFGSFARTGLRETTWGEPFFKGLAGLLVSPGKGLLWYVPLLFLLPWAAPRFYRRAPSLSLFFVALFAVPLFFYANLLYWHGDPAWGPRYLYTAVPYLVLPLGELATWWSHLRRRMRVFAVVVVLASLAIQCSSVAVSQWRFWYRIQAAEEHTSQPFRWGAQYYHYYWNVSQSPILMQFDNVYQVVRLTAFGTERYRLTTRPTACVLRVRCISNPADNYPLNTLSFWWTDVRHPLLGPNTREGLASILGGTATLSLILLVFSLGAVSNSPVLEQPDEELDRLTPTGA